ncbi:hypothetical protein [Apibacter sp. HY039]|uniref:hypothetical protein n=1 Tax=Apibacter sp. HY039 TaxID=2501476 RepID=UPI000FEBE483|nr:hypothetical protein [Apibacter sp. HY039]
MSACNDKKATSTPASADSTSSSTQAESSQTDPQPTESINAEIPEFSDPEIKKFAEDYTSFVKDLTAAYTAKDMTKAAELQQKAMEWANKSTEISKKLVSNPEDAKKFSEYTQKLTTELQSAMTAK